jgi:hypothetical protein
MQPSLQYFTALLEILSCACEQKNASTESKCQTMFKLAELLALMRASARCWPIRKSLMFLFFDVYLETEKEIKD